MHYFSGLTNSYSGGSPAGSLINSIAVGGGLSGGDFGFTSGATLTNAQWDDVLSVDPTGFGDYDWLDSAMVDPKTVAHLNSFSVDSPHALAGRWAGIFGFTWSGSNGPDGGGCIEVTGGSGASARQNMCGYLATNSFSAKLVDGTVLIPLNINSASLSTDVALFQFSDFTDCVIWCGLDSSRHLMIKTRSSGGTYTTVSTGATALPASGYVVVEFRWFPHATDGILSAWLHSSGTTTHEIDVHGVDTSVGGWTAHPGSHLIGTASTFGSAASSVGIRYGGLAVCETSGLRVSEYIGNSKTFIYRLMPNAAGAFNDSVTTGSATRYQNVDETTANDNTDYNTFATYLDKDTYNLEALAGTVVKVLAVGPTARVRSDTNSLGGKLSRLVYDGSTLFASLISWNGFATTLTGTAYTLAYSEVSDSYLTIRPSNSSPWDLSSVNALQGGVRREQYVGGSAADPIRVTQFVMEFLYRRS